MVQALPASTFCVLGRLLVRSWKVGVLEACPPINLLKSSLVHFSSFSPRIGRPQDSRTPFWLQAWFLGKTLFILSQCLSPPRNNNIINNDNYIIIIILMVNGDKILWCSLQWSSIPSRGSSNTPSRLHAKETSISSSSCVGQFGPSTALPFYLKLK